MKTASNGKIGVKIWKENIQNRENCDISKFIYRKQSSEYLEVKRKILETFSNVPKIFVPRTAKKNQKEQNRPIETKSKREKLIWFEKAFLWNFGLHVIKNMLHMVSFST